MTPREEAEEIIKQAGSLCKEGNSCRGVRLCESCKHEVWLITKALEAREKKGQEEGKLEVVASSYMKGIAKIISPEDKKQYKAGLKKAVEIARSWHNNKPDWDEHYNEGIAKAIEAEMK